MLIEIVSPAPILNTPDHSFAFGGTSGSDIPLSKKGLPYCFEFVALEGMVFEVRESIKSDKAEIYRIAAPFYPSENLYMDSRFAKPASAYHPKRPLPKPSDILKKMVEMTGAPYVWGGNWKEGIPELLDYYPPKSPIASQISILWTLKGVDCSGLLFEATDGATPRNTSQMLEFGAPVPINAPLKPLDMILYPGHVAFVVDESTTIESKYPFGVIQRDLPTRLWEFDVERKRIVNWSSEINPLDFYTARRFI